MRLSKIHVTNFRSVEDSTEFDVGQVLSLVGKNEAGKTALLQALAGLNPHPLTPIAYDVERDYPRRWLNDYANRYEDAGAVVVTTKWTITDEEKAAIRKEIGDALLDKPVTIYRRYGDAEPQWEELPIDFKKAVENLITSEKLDEEERQPLRTAADSTQLRTALEGIKERTLKQQRLLERLNGFADKTIGGLVTKTLTAGLPQFMYSSYFDRMVGQIRLDTYNARKEGQP